MSRFCCLASLIIFNTCLHGQEFELPEELVEQLSAELEESLSEEATPDALEIENLKIRDVNKSTRDELKKIPWLTNLQINNLLSYIDQNGPLVSTYELQAIPGWDLLTIRNTAVLLGIREIGSYYDPRSVKEQFKQDGGMELLFRSKRRLQLSHGYNTNDEKSFLGSPIYWLGRIRYQKKNSIDIGIHAEKDAGERFQWNPAKRFYGADYLSMFLKLENKGPVRRLILGDFKTQWDQGLLMGSGLTFKKQVITGPRKVHQGFQAHSGTREFNYYRGLALELLTGNLEISAMYSNRNLDAQLLDNEHANEFTKRFSSIIKTGLHRTQQEIKRRKQVPEQVIGLHLQKWWGKGLATSLSGAYSIWKMPLIPEKTPHKIYAFSGNRNINLSTSVEYQWRNMNIFSQITISTSLGWAAVAGFVSSLSHKVSMTMHLRNYSKNFHGIASNAFGVASNNINEQGIYWGLQISPSKKWVIGSYANIFRFPYPTYSSDQASSGIEQLVRVEYAPNRNGLVDLYWRGRKRQVNQNPMLTKFTHNLTEESRHSIGLRTKWQNGDQISLQSRIQYSNYQVSGINSWGMIVANQVSYDHKILKLTLSMAHFSTDNFENRQYIYEKDLPYSLSIPFYDGIGTRWFGLLQLKPLRKLDFWLKLAQTDYHDRSQVGRGLDTINDSKRTDLSIQIRYSL